MKRVLFALTALLLTCVPALAVAACNVTASVAFGPFNPLPGQQALSIGTVSVTCTGNVGDSASYTISISSGFGSFAARKMVSGSKSLVYNLYTDSGHTQVWGDGTGGTTTVSGIITLSSSSGTNTYSVSSLIAGGQNTAPAGTYSDSLSVTITY